MENQTSSLYTQYNFEPGFPFYAHRLLLRNYGYMPPQYHNCFEFGMCLKGYGTFSIGGRVMSFSAGSMVEILPGEVHFSLSTEENPSIWLCMFFMPEEFGITELPDHGTVFYSDSCFHLATVISDERDMYKSGFEERIGILLRLLFSRMNSVIPKAENIPRGLDMSAIAPAITHIANHFQEKIDAEVLAGLCGFSVGHFRREFKKALGVSPIGYLNNFRLTTAEQMLRMTDRLILDIAFDVGFGSVSAFNDAFKVKNGISARDYRKIRKGSGK